MFTDFCSRKPVKTSTVDNPPPDITIDSDGTNLVLQANNLKDSFNKAGEYADGSIR